MWKKSITSSATWIEKHFVKINVVLLVACIIGAIICSCMITNEHWVYWEVFALIAIFIFNGSLLYTGLSENKTWTVAFEKNNRVLCATLPIVGIFLSIIGAFATIYYRQLVPHLFCVFFMSLMFWRIDWLVRHEATTIAESKTEKLSDELRTRIISIRDDFEKSMFFIDLPSVIAFSVLTLTISIRTWNGTSEQVAYHENFVGGAIAFQLVASVVIFLFIMHGLNKPELKRQHSVETNINYSTETSV